MILYGQRILNQNCHKPLLQKMIWNVHIFRRKLEKWAYGYVKSARCIKKVHIIRVIHNLLALEINVPTTKFKEGMVSVCNVEKEQEPLQMVKVVKMSKNALEQNSLDSMDLVINVMEIM